MVTVAATEAFGSLGGDFPNLLEELATLAAENDKWHGRPRVDWKRKWTTQISMALARAAATTLEEAAGRTCFSCGGQNPSSGESRDSSAAVPSQALPAHAVGSETPMQDRGI